MSLRLRLTLVVAVTFALVVVGCVYAAHVSARHQLRAEADDFLLDALEPIHAHRAAIPIAGSDTTRRGDGGPAAPLADPDAVTQIVDAQRHGRCVRSPASRRSPSTANDRAIAKHGGRPALPRRHRRRAPLPHAHGRAARRRRGADRAQHRRERQTCSRRSTPPVADRAGRHLIAASLAWLIARRIVRPIEQLTTRRRARRGDAGSRPPDRRRRATTRSARSRRASTRMLDALRTSREQQTPSRAWTRATSCARRSPRCAPTSTCCGAPTRSTTSHATSCSARPTSSSAS